MYIPQDIPLKTNEIFIKWLKIPDVSNVQPLMMTISLGALLGKFVTSMSVFVKPILVEGVIDLMKDNFPAVFNSNLKMKRVSNSILLI